MLANLPLIYIWGMVLNNFPFCFTHCENCHKLEISSIQTECLSTFFFDLNNTTFDSEKEMPSLILFTLIKGGSSATDSIVGIASLINLVWQDDLMVYWGLRVLEWNGWFKEEKLLQLQSTISLLLLIFP